MLFVELHRPPPRFVIVASECAEGRVGKNLGAAEELLGSVLGRVPLQIGGLVLEMKDEPELYAPSGTSPGRSGPSGSSADGPL
jgi:hypothetical protein